MIQDDLSLYSQHQEEFQQAIFWISTRYRNAEEGTSSFMSLLTCCLQVLGYFLPYTLSNVVLISCDLKKNLQHIFFSFHA
jgi:hypothetical protein